MTLTIQLDEQTERRARQAAEAMGVSLDDLIAQYLHRLAGDGDAQNWIDEFRRLSLQSTGDSRGKTWTRDEIHAQRIDRIGRRS